MQVPGFPRPAAQYQSELPPRGTRPEMMRWLGPPVLTVEQLAEFPFEFTMKNIEDYLVREKKQAAYNDCHYLVPYVDVLALLKKGGPIGATLRAMHFDQVSGEYKPVLLRVIRLERSQQITQLVFDDPAAPEDDDIELRFPLTQDQQYLPNRYGNICPVRKSDFERWWPVKSAEPTAVRPAWDWSQQLKINEPTQTHQLVDAARESLGRLEWLEAEAFQLAQLESAYEQNGESAQQGRKTRAAVEGTRKKLQQRQRNELSRLLKLSLLLWAHHAHLSPEEAIEYALEAQEAVREIQRRQPKAREVPLVPVRPPSEAAKVPLSPVARSSPAPIQKPVIYEHLQFEAL